MAYLQSTVITGSQNVLNVAGSGSVSNTSLSSVNGNNGRLFEVTDDLSNSIFSANTIAGLPVIEAFADNTVRLGKYNSGVAAVNILSSGNVVIGTPGQYSDYTLEVSGAIKANGNIVVDLTSVGVASVLYGTGQLINGAADQPIVYLESTWNTSGNARGIEYRVTNTTSGASSKLLNLFVDSVTMFNVSKAGDITTGPPTGYTANPWKLGSAAGGTFSPTHYIIVEVNGQIYSIPALPGTP